MKARANNGAAEEWLRSIDRRHAKDRYAARVVIGHRASEGGSCTCAAHQFFHTAVDPYTHGHIRNQFIQGSRQFK